MSKPWKWLIGWLMLLVLVTGCTTPTQPTIQTDPRQAALTAISGQQVMTTVRELAGDQYQGRRAGTIGDRLATTYISEKMREAGTKPKGTKDQYLQSFETYVSSVKAPTRLQLTDLPGGSSKELRYSIDYRPNQYSVSGTASGSMVFAGYGVINQELKIDNFQGADLRGKVVLMIDGTPNAMENLSISVEAKAQWAKAYGAVGVLIGPDPRNTSEHQAWQQALRRGLGSRPGPNIIPTFLISPSVVTELMAGQDFASLMAKMEQGSKPIPLTSKVNATVTVESQEKGISNNILGFVAGSDPKKQNKVIVVGAHYDHLGINPNGEVNGGSNDNASGTAVILELARVLAKNPLPVSVLFAAWGAEESGLIGSQFFLNNPTVPLDQIIGYINLDMVGLKTGDLALHRNIRRENNPLMTTAQKATTAMQIPIQVRDFLSGSDGYNFDLKGIPTIWFADVWNNSTLPQYHTPDDKPELLSDLQLATVAKLVCATVWDYAQSIQ